MKVSIKADGSLKGTKVLADGKDLGGKISRVRFDHEAGVPPTIELDLVLIDMVEITGEARMIGPGGKQVKRIEYMDGAVEDFE